MSAADLRWWLIVLAAMAALLTWWWLFPWMSDDALAHSRSSKRSRSSAIALTA
jgi:threonine/homoserine/homoserine lactone efflux protein